MQLTNAVMGFIEELVTSYKLEDFLVGDDASLKNMLSVAHPHERLGLKIIFSKTLSTLVLSSGKSINDILPSIKLKNIIFDIINKKIPFDNLPQIIQGTLSMSLNDADEISNSIKNNPDIDFLIKNPSFQENIYDEEAPAETTSDNTKNTKSIGYELLK